MIKLPESIDLANLPTKIEKLDRLSKYLNGPEIYIKRDDQTGSEFSGNKVRKLEFAVQEALNEGCDYLITCGGIQSNHARATAAVAAKLGIGSYLVLRTNKEEMIDGNYFLDGVLGAKIRFITAEEYRERRMEIMKEVKEELDKKGHKAYIIPEGSSNGIGAFGYFKAMEEIFEQEKEMGIKFDAIVLAVGSGGTYAGLFYANKYYKNNAKVYGINVCDDEKYFKNAINNILYESFQYTKESIEFFKDEINIIDGYVGKGYALSRPEEITFIHELAKLEGVILDPVYTGKAMYGLVEEIKKGNFKEHNNILFIHTGGLFGLFPQKGMFKF
ncbi:D-cysteine desulfhydrase family protein [Clostridium lundense]|uniref:D-cysteine desulfhydrase family protein n=1 Tax=Clostridium lundense TaxID=319475 RepID=UPI0004821A0F|nr:D-cysteine desulfhydrase family protein [Clostridium lundense]